MKSSYKNKRVRCNLALLLSSEKEHINGYIQDLNCRGITCSSFISYFDVAQTLFPDKKITKLKHVKILEKMLDEIQVKMINGDNIMVDIPLFNSEDRKLFVVSLHNICRINRLRGSFTCIYFKEENNLISCPDSEELWNDILIRNSESVRQIVINYNVIF